MNQTTVIPFPQREANNRPVSRERLTPQSLESEQSTLGAMLMERDAVARAVELLTPDDFYRELHKKIYKAVLKLFDKGEPIDIVTVAEELRRNGQLDDVGGSEYLSALIEACPSSANIDAYATIVGEKSVLRQLVKASDEIAGWAYADGTDPVHELVDRSEKRIFEIGSQRLRAGFSHIKPLLMTAYDQIERQFQHKGEATGISTGFVDLDDITSGLQPTDFVILAARPSMGKCLKYDAKIVDPDTGAIATIEEMVARRQTRVANLSTSGALQVAPISDWIDSGVKPVYRVTTRLGRSVEVTGHHPFLTVSGWVPLHDLKVGGHIAVPRSLPVFGIKDTISRDKIRLLAYFIAEGGLSGSGPKWTNADPVLVADFCEAIEREFPELEIKAANNSGIDYKIVRPNRGTGMAPNALTAWLREIGLWGKKADQKFVPAEVWAQSKASLAEFLRVLFSCDGTIYKLGNHPRIEFEVASQTLAEQVQHALLRFGIIAKLWRKTERCWRVEITDPTSVLLYNTEIGWVGEKTGRFIEIRDSLPKRVSNNGHAPREIWDLVKAACKRQGISLVELARRAGETTATGKYGGYNPHMQRGLPSYRLRAYAEVLQDAKLFRASSPDIYWDEITAIEPIGEHQVYDLTVPDGSNFIAQDVCVHNTALVLNIAHHIALKERQPVAVFSLEMSKEQLVQRLICSEASIKSQDLRRGKVQDSDWHRITNAVNNLYQAPIFIDDQPGQSTFEMRAKARRLTAEHGQLGLIVVDYLQLAHSSGKSENRVQEISEIARAFKSMARELKCPLIALSQLSRAVEQREDKRPMLSDLRESGSIEAEADVVAFIYRPSYYKRKMLHKDGAPDPNAEPDPDEGLAEVIIGKQRNGPVGTIRLGFQPEYARFTNLARNDYGGNY
jgi:replicative DNA helicase